MGIPQLDDIHGKSYENLDDKFRKILFVYKEKYEYETFFYKWMMTWGSPTLGNLQISTT
jgi:hypothetical protein